MINDFLSDTSHVAPDGESFTVSDRPDAGLRYGGVAFAAVPEPSAWAIIQWASPDLPARLIAAAQTGLCPDRYFAVCFGQRREADR